MARLASGGRHGMAQSIFQVGGNTGSAIGPLLAAFIVLPHGQRGAAWFSILALLGFLVLLRVSRWYKARLQHLKTRPVKQAEDAHGLPPRKVVVGIAILIALVFSKFFYLASITSYYTFYLMARFHIGVRSAQLHLFAFLGAVAAGTLIGGPIGDRFGRKAVIWWSILGVLPLTLLLPYANFLWTGVLSVLRRLDAGFGLPCNRRLRAGTRARTGGHDLGTLLWLCLRHGRHRRSHTRQDRRRNQHLHRVQDMRVPSGDWLTGGFSPC